MKPDGYLLPQNTDIDTVIAEVARGFKVTVDDIMGRSYRRRVTIARACAMAIVRQGTDLSYPAIGDIFDRDHSTVINAVQKVMADPELSRAVEEAADEVRRMRAS